ncbi:catalase/peroxidase HPI [Parvularcula sp. ZS-1/3]|uniref:Catalase-peroxidase n=2 Tax=Parvularcula mediterranea TaxID=2732508 RepID=A0A7Y3RJI3_9PROT|nr:catalase/peroxidase HPI [Parvularcula mediterranea]
MPKPNRFWWPETVDLSPLRQHEADSNPLGPDFDYAKEFAKLDLAEVKADIEEVMTTSQDWWPADYGHYGPFFIRMAWHSAGTYRLADGRGGAAGGQLRFEPLNSWPDNTNLDKARRLLWPIKAKYGHALSWSDLMVLTGNVAMESMGFETIGFAGGREDAWQPELVYWGAEEDFLANNKRYDEDGKLKKPLGASVMGLIYVNPEGPNRSHDPIAAAADIRETFGRMAMNDEETVALIAGGHTFGKAHGAHKPEECLSREPAATGIAGQGVGWNNKCGKGNAEDTVTSGLEGAWTADPARWTHQYLTFLYQFEWEKTESPAGAIQWKPVEEEAQQLVPDAHREDIRHAPMMLTTDIALKEDPAYREITTRFLNDPEEFELAFAKAWFKLTHRDMGPREGYLGDMAPEETFVWQDPVEAPDYQLVNRRDIANLKADILDTELTVGELVRTAWASAASYRGTDNRGGTNGARIRFAPQNGWEVNNPAELDKVLSVLEGIQGEFNDRAPGGRQISMADMIVLAGAAAIEKAASDAGHDITVPFTPGRGDATEEMTDAASFDWLEPTYDAFRNYGTVEGRLTRVQRMVDRADLLTLTVPEMTVLMGGMRSLGANAGGVEEGILVDNPGTLTNDFFQNLLDMRTAWKPAEGQEGVFVGSNRMTGEEKWRATDVDLVFGSNSELRAVVERYAYDGAEDEFVDDFVDAWTKVMNLGRVDQS